MIYREFVVTNMHEQTVYIMKKKIQIYAHCKQCHFYFLSKAATSFKKKKKKNSQLTSIKKEMSKMYNALQYL